MQFSIETDRFLAVSDASYIKHDDVYGIIKHHLYSDKAVWYSNELRLSHGCALIKCKQLGYALLTLETEEEYGCFQVYLKRHHDLFDDFTHYGAHLENFTSNDEWKWSANGEKMKFAPQWGNLHPNGNERCVCWHQIFLSVPYLIKILTFVFFQISFYFTWNRRERDLEYSFISRTIQ
jgi:hypothetical protein